MYSTQCWPFFLLVQKITLMTYTCTEDFNSLSHEPIWLFKNLIVIKLVSYLQNSLHWDVNLYKTFGWCLIYEKNADLSWPDKVSPCKHISTKDINIGQFWGVFSLNKLNATLYLRGSFDSAHCLHGNSHKKVKFSSIPSPLPPPPSSFTPYLFLWLSHPRQSLSW